MMTELKSVEKKWAEMTDEQRVAKLLEKYMPFMMTDEYELWVSDGNVRVQISHTGELLDVCYFSTNRY